MEEAAMGRQEWEDAVQRVTMRTGRLELEVMQQIFAVVEVSQLTGPIVDHASNGAQEDDEFPPPPPYSPPRISSPPQEPARVDTSNLVSVEDNYADESKDMASSAVSEPSDMFSLRRRLKEAFARPGPSQSEVDALVTRGQRSSELRIRCPRN